MQLHLCNLYEANIEHDTKPTAMHAGVNSIIADSGTRRKIKSIKSQSRKLNAALLLACNCWTILLNNEIKHGTAQHQNATLLLLDGMLC